LIFAGKARGSCLAAERDTNVNQVGSRPRSRRKGSLPPVAAEYKGSPVFGRQRLLRQRRERAKIIHGEKTIMGRPDFNAVRQRVLDALNNRPFESDRRIADVEQEPN
jgi:hypothetical protein